MVPTREASRGWRGKRSHGEQARVYADDLARAVLTFMSQTSMPCIRPKSSNRSTPVACEMLVGTSPLFEPSPWIMGGPWWSSAIRRTDAEKARIDGAATAARGRRAGATAARAERAERRAIMVVMEDVVVVRRKGKTELRVVQLVTSPRPAHPRRLVRRPTQVSLSGGADGAARGTSRPPPPPPRSSLRDGPLATSLGWNGGRDFDDVTEEWLRCVLRSSHHHVRLRVVAARLRRHGDAVPSLPWLPRSRPPRSRSLDLLECSHRRLLAIVSQRIKPSNIVARCSHYSLLALLFVVVIGEAFLRDFFPPPGRARGSRFRGLASSATTAQLPGQFTLRADAKAFQRRGGRRRRPGCCDAALLRYITRRPFARSQLLLLLSSPTNSNQIPWVTKRTHQPRRPPYSQQDSSRVVSNHCIPPREARDVGWAAAITPTHPRFPSLVPIASMLDAHHDPPSSFSPPLCPDLRFRLVLGLDAHLQTTLTGASTSAPALIQKLSKLSYHHLPLPSTTNSPHYPSQRWLRLLLETATQLLTPTATVTAAP